MVPTRQKDPPPDIASRLIASVSDEAIIALDPSGRVISWNPGAWKIFGYDAAAAIGLPLSAFYPQDAAEAGAHAHELRRAREGGFDSDGWQITSAGNRFRAHIFTTSLTDEAGSPIGYARAVRDITERLRAEEALRLSEAKFSGILAIASEAIISIDEAQRIVLYNQGAERIFGYSADEAVGQPLEILIPDRFRSVHARQVEEFGEGPTVARRMGERGNVGIFGKRKTGEVFPAEASISKLDVGESRLYTVVLRDVTLQRQAEEEREALLSREREARGAAEDAAHARDDVLRIVSHDLGNSLSAMLVTTRVLLRTLPDGEWADEARKRIESVRHLAEQMQRLRQDLLDVARLEAGQLRIVAERHDPGSIVESAIRDFAAVAEEQGIALTCHVAPDLPTVDADRERVLQVLSNLIGNAIKFTPDGGRIDVVVGGGLGEVRFQVRDTGSGIQADHLPNVFDRFWQARIAHRAGAGLGLAISRGIVQAHGGEIDVESILGEGSVFTFTLPASRG